MLGCCNFFCARCERRTGGHFWGFCQVTRTERRPHFCCPGDCELSSHQAKKWEGDHLSLDPMGLCRSGSDPEYAYHGTPHPDKVLSEGLRGDLSTAKHCKHVWLSLTPGAAAEYGRVLMVDLVYLNGTWPREENGDLFWQASYLGSVPPWAIELPVNADR